MGRQGSTWQGCDPDVVAQGRRLYPNLMRLMEAGLIYKDIPGRTYVLVASDGVEVQLATLDAQSAEEYLAKRPTPDMW